VFKVRFGGSGVAGNEQEMKKTLLYLQFKFICGSFFEGGEINRTYNTSIVSS
jgi:hypothetical protein